MLLFHAFNYCFKCKWSSFGVRRELSEPLGCAGVQMPSLSPAAWEGRQPSVPYRGSSLGRAVSACLLLGPTVPLWWPGCWQETHG